MRTYDQIKLGMLHGLRANSDEQEKVLDMEQHGVCPDCGTVGAMSTPEAWAAHKLKCWAWRSG